jgi:hypothetical protein
VDLAVINERIAAVHRDRSWILNPDVAVAVTPLVEQLNEWGSGPIMVVAAQQGVGDPPEAERIFYTGARGDTVMQSIRAHVESIEDPSRALLDAVDAFDPDRVASNLFGHFSRRSELYGRPVYGARPTAWSDLEDKMLVDELCDAAGIRRAPSAIVTVGDAAEAATWLASDQGTVWVADNREGWHGGGEYVRWVPGPADASVATGWFSQHADRVRVMPFLEGVPCSIHGFNTADGTAVFRPVEMMIFRHGEQPAFIYGQAANFWEPPPGITEQMRRAARRMGAVIAERVGYLGGFGIDGVATADGFLPTELNPRSSVGHYLHARAADVPLGSIERLLVAGDLDVEAAELEDRIVRDAVERRGGGMLLRIDGDYAAAETGVDFTADGPVASDAEECDATMRIGPGPHGTVLIVRLDAERNPVGPRLAPRMLQAVDLARELWGIEAPPMRPAPDPF